MTDPPPLSVEGLEVRYGPRVALSGVDLTVRPGEIVALAGPNGSGKTTLLRAILGLVPATQGSVRLHGRPTRELAPRERAREAAWVPQDESIRDDIPLRDYVLLGRFAHRGLLDPYTPDDYAIVRQRIEDAGLADREGDGIRTLSGGERQRATLARALAQEAPLLLLDEPTSHLDIGHQLDLLERVRALSRRTGVAVVAALHDLNLAGRFADRILVLSHGRPAAEGTPRDVLSEGLLRRVWGVSAERRTDQRTGAPYLIPIARLPLEEGTPEPRGGITVHVVGGGGSAGPYLHALVEEGCAVTAGTLPLFDSDTETAASLGIPLVEEIPFAPLGETARARTRALLRAADAVLVAPFAVGPSNLGNLEDLASVPAGRPIYLVRRPPIGDRDFTGGRARALYDSARARGAIEVDGVEDLRALVRAERARRRPDGP
ncbi:MAG: ABC transporter ATP-binding protein [Thermoplasmata archaeon]